MREYRMLIIGATFLLVAGCTGEQRGQKKVELPAATQTKPLSPDESAIRASLAELFGRTKEGDKTVLYENECSYFKDTVSLSAYMELRKVKEYKYDTLKGIEVDSTTIMGDSAWAYVRIIYESSEGAEHPRPYRLSIYHSRGNWIKPYQSRWAEERDYQKQRRIYDSLTAGQ